jgi:CCR4-NOT complex subunit CAF16
MRESRVQCTLARMANAIETRDLNFAYDEGHVVFRKLSLAVPEGARCLLIGANGVGKSTLLRLIAGRHLLREDSLRVFGRQPFFDLSVADEVSLVDADFPLVLDLSVDEVLAAGKKDARMEKELIELLGIDRRWRMHRVSDGQRRRVQLCLALRRKIRLLLLDEVTIHLDVVVRADLLSWLRERSRRDDLTVIYTTHILDGLWAERSRPWPTHLCFIDTNGSATTLPWKAIPWTEGPSPLLRLCETWIRQDKAALRHSRSRNLKKT